MINKIIEEEKKIKAMLIKHGATDIKSYLLINNSGYEFIIKGVKYDLRHWRNVYGCEVDYYRIIETPKNDYEIVKAINKEANEILKSINE